MEFEHIPVLLEETIEGLNIDPNGTYVDATLGGGGHSEEILKRLEGGRLIGLDQDGDAIAYTTEKLKKYGDKFTAIRTNFSRAKERLNEIGIEKINGVLMDIGVSSHQIDEEERGFSYRFDADLDMRMDQRKSLDAKYIVNNYSTEDLERIFFDYGEEKWTKRIVEFIDETRREREIKTTLDLVDLIERAVPKAARLTGGHPAKRVFQALRIEVNGELEVLEKSVPTFVDMLLPKGRICVITFHSLEDRIVKNIFQDLNKDCICPPELPVCMCDHRRKLKLINKKPIVADDRELEINPRAKSAKLRIGQRV